MVAEARAIQLEDASDFAPECGVATESRARPPRPARDLRGATGRRSCASSSVKATTPSPSLPLGFGDVPGSGQPGHVRCRGRRPRGRGRSACAGGASVLMPAGTIRLRGAHNLENAMAAAAAALARGHRPRRRKGRDVDLPRGGAPPRGRRRTPRGPLRQRLQGDQRGLDTGRADRVRAEAFT